MLSPLILSLALAQQPPCAAGERLVMTCSVKKKALTVCAGPATGALEWLQYRFGPPGKPELVYPKEPDGSLERFRLLRRTLLHGTSTALSFAQGGVAYEVYTQDGKDAGGGVNVRGKDGKVVAIGCTSTPQESWDLLGTAVPEGDVDVALHADRCRRAAQAYADDTFAAGKGQLDGVQQSEFFEAADTQCRAGWTAEAAECVAARKQPCPALTAAQRRALDVRTQEIINR
jgi:hypothetical protein